MTQLSNINNQTMSSREIAELTDKEHKNVKRDIEKMLTDLCEDALKFERIYIDSMNRDQTEYHLDRDLTDCLLTGYSTSARMRVIKRWRELEKQATNPVAALSRIDLLKMAQDSPVLMRQMTDPTFATTSIDDLDTLTQI